MNIKLSIIIPAYNEEKRILPSLEKIYNFILSNKQFTPCEIIIVNDGSTDTTEKIVNSFINSHEDKNIFLKIINQPNTGKGGAVKKGVLNSLGEFILFSDADLSTPIEELNMFFKYINDYDVVIANRADPKSNIIKRQNIIRETMGKIFNKIIQSILNIKFKDTQCGFKLFKKDAAYFLFNKMKINGFAFDAEIIFLCQLFNLKVIALPVKWINSELTKVHIIKDSFKMLIDVIKVRFLFKYK